jgi:hypothetical protein
MRTCLKGRVGGFYLERRRGEKEKKETRSERLEVEEEKKG